MDVKMLNVITDFTMTGSYDTNHFEWLEDSQIWWYNASEGHNSGCVWDFRYGFSLSPNPRLLFAAVVPFVSSGLVDRLRYTARWAVMTQAFCRATHSLKGPGRSRWLMQLHSLWCQSSLEKKKRKKTATHGWVVAAEWHKWFCFSVSTWKCHYVFACLLFFFLKDFLFAVRAQAEADD